MSRSKASRRAAARRPAWSWWWGLLLVAAALGALAVWQMVSAAVGTGGPLQISVAEAAAQRDAGAFILDVREPDEWEDFHVPGSTHIPLGQLAERTGELPRDQAIVVVCRSGNRSQQGRDILLEAGFAEVTSMRGGLNEWQSLGLPIVTGP